MMRSVKNLIAALLIAISGFLFWTEILPAYNFTSVLKTTINERSELLTARSEIIQKIESLSAEKKKKFSELQRLALVIPESKGTPELLTTFEAMFSQSGNVMAEIVISDPVFDESLGKISVELSGKGNYSSLLTLLELFEKNIRVFDVTSMGVSSNQVSTEQQDPGLDISIVGSVYIINPAGQANVAGRVHGEEL